MVEKDGSLEIGKKGADRNCGPHATDQGERVFQWTHPLVPTFFQEHLALLRKFDQSEKGLEAPDT